MIWSIATVSNHAKRRPVVDCAFCLDRQCRLDPFPRPCAEYSGLPRGLRGRNRRIGLGPEKIPVAVVRRVPMELEKMATTFQASGSLPVPGPGGIVIFFRGPVSSL